MKLKMFRIQHYKSIIDSGDCPLGDDFTTIIGKNESGKTAILEALRDFDRDVTTISTTAYPVSGVNVSPQIEFTFEISAQELDDIINESGHTIDLATRRDILGQGVRILKTATGEYHLSKGNFKQSSAQMVKPTHVFGPPIDDEINKLSKLIGVSSAISIIEDQEGVERAIGELRRMVLRQLNFVRDETRKKEAVETLHGITKLLKTYELPYKPQLQSTGDPQSSSQVFEKIKPSVLSRLPRFVYFSDFKDVLPFEATLNDLKTNQSLRDLSFLAGQDLNEIVAIADPQKRMNLLNRYSAKVSGNFLDQWQQDTIEIVIRPEGDKFIFGIKEKNGTDLYKMDQRSKGLQWFLSFYLKLSRFTNQEVVLLIDEPGTNLHPVAQKDILRLIKSTSTGTKQIIFSTHSSALIEANRLDRVRCVVKDARGGTTIITEVTTAVDDDTLLPVKGALATGLPVRIPSPGWTALNVAENKSAAQEEEEESEENEEITPSSRISKRAYAVDEEEEESEEEIEEEEEVEEEPVEVSDENSKDVSIPQPEEQESAASILKRTLDKKVTEPESVTPSTTAVAQPAATSTATEAPAVVTTPQNEVAKEAEERIRKAVVKEKAKNSHAKRRSLFGWLGK